jgi:hypothetical protein
MKDPEKSTIPHTLHRLYQYKFRNTTEQSYMPINTKNMYKHMYTTTTKKGGNNGEKPRSEIV